MTVFKTNAPLHLRESEEETGFVDGSLPCPCSISQFEGLESSPTSTQPGTLRARPVLHAFLLSRGPLRPLLFSSDAPSVNEFVVRKQKWCRLRSSLERRREGMRSVYHCLYSASSLSIATALLVLPSSPVVSRISRAAMQSPSF